MRSVRSRSTHSAQRNLRSRGCPVAPVLSELRHLGPRLFRQDRTHRAGELREPVLIAGRRDHEGQVAKVSAAIAEEREPGPAILGHVAHHLGDRRRVRPVHLPEHVERYGTGHVRFRDTELTHHDHPAAPETHEQDDPAGVNHQLTTLIAMRTAQAALVADHERSNNHG